MSEEKDNIKKPAEQDGNRMLRNKMILETSIDGFCVVGFDGKLLEVNSSLCDIIGYSKEELLRMKITDIEVSETAEQTTQHIDKIMKQGYDRFETKLRRKDGKTIDIEVSTQYCDFEEDKFFFSFLRDITEYKKAQNELGASETRFRKLSDAAFEGIVIHENRRVLDANRRFVEMFGYMLDELREMDGLDMIAEEFRETIINNITSGYEGLYETVGLRRDGSRFPMEIQVKRIHLKDRTLRVAGIRDITLQRQLETEREGYKENLLKAQRHAYIGSMGAIVAHQVNQPLTKINMLLDRAIEYLEEVSCSPVALKNVKEGLAEAQKAASIIHKFRQYSKNSALEGTGEVNVSVITDRIVSVLSEKARRTKVRISSKGLQNLPEVEINETALEQIFLIIIQNAIEAADGQKTHKLNITGKFADGNIELQFADDCCGIAPENLDKIFEPFFSTKTKDKGLGLGLDIVQQILISCGGQIRVESQIGKGTTLYVTLPISNILKP